MNLFKKKKVLYRCFFLFNHFPLIWFWKGDAHLPVYFLLLLHKKVGVTVCPFSPVHLFQCKLQRKLQMLVLNITCIKTAVKSFLQPTFWECLDICILVVLRIYCISYFAYLALFHLVTNLGCCVQFIPFFYVQLILSVPTKFLNSLPDRKLFLY